MSHYSNSPDALLVLIGAAQILSSAVLATETGIESVKPTPVGVFKEFLSSPHVVRALVFSERVPGDGRGPTTATLLGSEHSRYYEAVWQPSAYLLREVPNFDSGHRGRASDWRVRRRLPTGSDWQSSLWVI